MTLLTFEVSAVIPCSHQHVSLQRHVIYFYDDEMEINPQAMDIQTRLIMHDQIHPSHILE